MRHNKKFNHLGRTASHRNAMLANMATSLILSEHKRITTTLAKAKALKKYVEPLITRSKNDTTTSRRVVFRYLQNKYAVKALFGEVAEKVANRPGGYTRVIKLGTRQGDAAEIAFIELVDFDENMAKTPKAAAKKTRRSRKAKAEDAPVAENAGIVNDDKFQIMLQLIFTAFTAHLGNTDSRRIINDQFGIPYDSGSFDEFRPVSIRQITGTKCLCIYTGFQGEQSVYQLLLRHFQ